MIQRILEWKINGRKFLTHFFGFLLCQRFLKSLSMRMVVWFLNGKFSFEMRLILPPYLAHRTQQRINKIWILIPKLQIRPRTRFGIDCWIRWARYVWVFFYCTRLSQIYKRFSAKNNTKMISSQTWSEKMITSLLNLSKLVWGLPLVLASLNTFV